MPQQIKTDGLVINIEQRGDTVNIDIQTRSYFLLRATSDTLNMREEPSTTANVVATLDKGELMATENVDLALRVGKQGEWIPVVAKQSITGYVAAWLVEPYRPTLPAPIPQSTQPTQPPVTTPPITTPPPVVVNPPPLPLPANARSVTGVNLDLRNINGRPNPALLGNIGWARFLFNLSANPAIPEGDDRRYGNTDLPRLFAEFDPYLLALKNAGAKTILIFTHQLYGEGRYDWRKMNGKWESFAVEFAKYAKAVAAYYAGKGLVSAYQIWNEQDSPPDTVSAVPIPAADYGRLFATTYNAIREVDSTTQIITGGHVTGSGTGAPYALASLTAMGGVRPDGIAVHPYHCKATRTPKDRDIEFNAFVGDEIDAYYKLLNKPIWITEYGVLDRERDSAFAPRVADYAVAMVTTARGGAYAAKVACMTWFAWGMGMHNGYGLWGWDNKPVQPLFDRFTSL